MASLTADVKKCCSFLVSWIQAAEVILVIFDILDAKLSHC